MAQTDNQFDELGIDELIDQAIALDKPLDPKNMTPEEVKQTVAACIARGMVITDICRHCRVRYGYVLDVERELAQHSSYFVTMAEQAAISGSEARAVLDALVRKLGQVSVTTDWIEQQDATKLAKLFESVGNYANNSLRAALENPQIAEEMALGQNSQGANLLPERIR